MTRKNQKAAKPSARKTKDWKASDAILRRINLFVEGIGGQGNGTHEIENKSTFVAVAVGVSPDRRIVAENGDAVRE